MTKSACASSLRYSPFPLFPKLPSRLSAVGLRNDGTGTDDFPTLAPGIPSRTDLIQATLGSRQILRLRQGARACRLTRPIDVEDLPLSTCSVQQFASLLLLSERAREQLLHKERAQGFNSLQGKDGKKATERRAGGQFLAVEQGHERL